MKSQEIEIVILRNWGKYSESDSLFQRGDRTRYIIPTPPNCTLNLG